LALALVQVGVRVGGGVRVRVEDRVLVRVRFSVRVIRNIIGQYQYNTYITDIYDVGYIYNGYIYICQKDMYRTWL
jgi:hypothetical protein